MMKLQNYFVLALGCFTNLFCTGITETENSIVIESMADEVQTKIRVKDISGVEIKIQFSDLFGSGTSSQEVQLNNKGWVIDWELKDRIIDTFKTKSGLVHPIKPTDAIVRYKNGAFQIREFITVSSMGGAQIDILLEEIGNQFLTHMSVGVSNKLLTDETSLKVKQKISEETGIPITRIQAIAQTSDDDFQMYNYISLPERSIAVRSGQGRLYISVEAGSRLDDERYDAGYTCYSVSILGETMTIDMDNLPTNEAEMRTFLEPIANHASYFVFDFKPAPGFLGSGYSYSCNLGELTAENIMRAIGLILDWSEITSIEESPTEEECVRQISEFIPLHR